MKRIISMILILLMCPMIYGSNNDGQTQNQEKTMMQTDVVGLEQVQLRVRNEEQKQQMEQVMEKIQTRDRERINQLNDVVIEESIEGKIIVEGLGESKFLHIFKMQKMFKYEISEEGEVERQLGILERLIWSDYNS